MIKYILPVLLLFFIGCSGGDSGAPANKLPIAKIDADKTKVSAAESVHLDGTKSIDSDGQIVSYRWSEKGKRIGAKSSLDWSSQETGEHIITLKVIDDDGGVSEKSILITVDGPPNSAPIAKIAALNSNTVMVNSQITLDGSASSDSDGNISNYLWRITGAQSGSQTLSAKVVSWKPTVVDDYTITLTVTDNRGATNQASKSVKVVEEILADREIFLIGDSTVLVGNPVHTGWGQRLDTHMKNPSLLTNAAEGGSSSRSYKVEDSGDEWWWSKLQNVILSKDTSTGAYLLIQLGHEDVARTLAIAEDPNNKYTVPGRNKTFYTELKVYIDWAREHQITPILVTPVEPMEVPMERYYMRSYGDYAQTVRELAEDEGVVLLDLEEKSYQEFDKYSTIDALLADFGVASSHDQTHFSSQGATTVSKWVTELACDPNTGDVGLCAQFK